MNDDAILRATGRSAAQWFEFLSSGSMGTASHKEIADYLVESCGVSGWWAQTITVEFERHIGRRVVGQTHDGSFQAGVSRTVGAPVDLVWQMLNSPGGIRAILGADTSDLMTGDEVLESLDLLDGTTSDGLTVTTTTFVPGSHVRLRWREPAWTTHSILQIRVTPKDDGRTTLSFHHEKLPSAESRDQVRSRWRAVATEIATSVATAATSE